MTDKTVKITHENYPSVAFDPLAERFLSAKQTNRQIDSCIFNRPIIACTQILVNRWGPEQGFRRWFADGLNQTGRLLLLGFSKFVLSKQRWRPYLRPTSSQGLLVFPPPYWKTRTLSSSYPTDETKLLTAVVYVLLWKLRLPAQNYALLCRLDTVLWSLESCTFFIICLVRTLFLSSYCWWSKIEIIEKGSLKAAHPHSRSP